MESQKITQYLRNCLLIATLAIALGGCAGHSQVTKKRISTAINDIDCPDKKHAFDAYFVCLHNRHRHQLPPTQPAASPSLPTMRWNQALADYAQQHVNKCQWQHSEDKHRQSTLGKITGENLFISTFPGAGPKQAMQSWMGEAVDFDYNNNRCTGPACGHYTQVVWRSSVEVGCAVSICATVKGSNLQNARLISCNYSPAGNYIGQKPY